MLGRAGRLTPGGLRAALARAVIEVAPGKARKRREQAQQDARVQRGREDSGNAAIMGSKRATVQSPRLASVLSSTQVSRARPLNVPINDSSKNCLNPFTGPHDQSALAICRAISTRSPGHLTRGRQSVTRNSGAGDRRLRARRCRASRGMTLRDTFRINALLGGLKVLRVVNPVVRVIPGLLKRYEFGAYFCARHRCGALLSERNCRRCQNGCCDHCVDK